MSNNDIKTDVWCNGEIDKNNDKNDFRKDVCGAWIKLSAHGDRQSDFGWEIHHIKAESKGGSNNISNLIPLHWKNNLDTGDDDKITCTVTSNGNKNSGL